MSNNTVLNPGTGGDTLRTDDMGSYKIPASKIIVGASGTDGGYVSSANPMPVTGSVSLTAGVSATLVSGSVTGLLQGGQAVSAANPVPTLAQSGSTVGILVGGVAASNANPVPITGTIAISRGVSSTSVSGSVTGLLVGGVSVSDANPVPVGTAYEASTQILSGSTVRQVYQAFGNFGASGSANQVVPPVANGRIALLSAHVMAAGSVIVQWASTGSVGTINPISGYMPCPANGGFVLPHNPHGWLKTNVNEGLNLSLMSTTNVGVIITWAIFNNP